MKTILLDRDGTLHVDQVRQVDIGKLVLMPGARDAIRLWNDAGWRILVITNQSGLARGFYTEAQMHAFHRALAEALGGRIDGYYWCPHMPDAGCACRKPGTALIERAAREHGFDPKSAFMVGDSHTDMGAGDAVGAQTVLVPHAGRDYDVECLAALGRLVRPRHVARDLADAARWTLEQP